MPQPTQQFDTFLFSLVSPNNWYWQILAIMLATLIINYLIVHSLKRLEKSISTTDRDWDDALLKSAYLPIRITGWLIGMTPILGILHKQFHIGTINTLFYQFRKVAFIYVLALFLYSLVNNFHQRVLLPRHHAGLVNTSANIANSKKRRLDESSMEAVSKLLRISIVILATLTILQVLGYSISGILAFGGMGGVAVGFAAKDLLSNFFGGLMIYLDKPFKAGDWVRSPDRNIEGTVEHIGWRISRIRTLDKRPLYIPNSLFTKIIVENPSRMSHRRIKETIGIRYDDWLKMPAIVAEVKTMLMAHPKIDTSQTLICNFDEFNASSLDFFIYAFTKSTSMKDYHAVKQDVLFQVFDIIESNGAEIAFPTQTLLMNQIPSSETATL